MTERMAPQAHAMSTHHLRRHLVFLLTVAAVTTTRAATTDTAAPAPSAVESRSTEPSAASFLRVSCATTLYSALCYNSLIPYASEFQTSHVRLARVAADVAAARLRALSSRVKDILDHGPEPAEGSGGRPSETDALRDCASTISSAADQARKSSAALKRLDASQTANAAGGDGSSRQSKWELSNAKTFLSAAMTNVGTCADGLDEAGATASPGGKEVTTGVVSSVRQYTSNALALVNGIAL